MRAVCTGVVQGVGFRPAVFRHARRYALAGFVANSPQGAVVEVEGKAEDVEGFFQTLAQALPPLARLEGLQLTEMPPKGEKVFLVAESQQGPRERALVPPDTAICEDCRRELEDPLDRRYRYPFTTCTNCGPRFSLVRELPYDRSRTAMACFPLCQTCQMEYQDPTNRRFHAEPVCCPQCGPNLKLLLGDGRQLAGGEQALMAVKSLLAEGKIVAVKGLGGFQLACRADQEAPARLLRWRKRRQAKPLAVMVRDLEVAGRLAVLGEEEKRLLSSPKAPILLLPRRPGAALAWEVAPGLGDVGIMLPTTPLHVELFRGAVYEALVMTSGNSSDEPICRTNREALARLQNLADAYLLHDRDVVRRVDDSVCRSGPQGPYLIRRSRGFVPTPVRVPVATPKPILALGGFLQNTVALGLEGEAYPSQHVGDLDTELARSFLREVVANLEDFLQVQPDILVADLHPDYPSRLLAWEMARERGGKVLEVQHHLAHGAAVLGEHGLFPKGQDRVGILALDGTGYGPDDTAWGGELLTLAGDLQWERVGWLQPLPLVGGEAAVREPLRVAVAALVSAGRPELVAKLPNSQPEVLEGLARLAKGGWPLASGAGRVFEAAGAILGLGETNRFEGELAMRLEASAGDAWEETRPWPGLEAFLEGSCIRSDWLLVELVSRRQKHDLPRLSAGFHASFSWLMAEAASRLLRGISAVAIGGGCLVNRLLRAFLTRELTHRGFRALLPRRLPPGDGGLSYGQVVLAATALARGVEPHWQGGGSCA